MGRSNRTEAPRYMPLYFYDRWEQMKETQKIA